MLNDVPLSVTANRKKGSTSACAGTTSAYDELIGLCELPAGATYTAVYE